ncbi:MAG: OmpA family protein [Rikenellaceae bacterium]
MKSTIKRIAQCLAIAMVMTLAAPTASAQKSSTSQSQSKTKEYKTSFYFSNGNSKTIEKSEYSKSANLVKWLKANPSAKVTITGWASTSGKPEVNKAVSAERAETIKKYLVSKGVSAKQIKASGKGSTTTKNARRADVVAVAKK